MTCSDHRPMVWEWEVIPGETVFATTETVRNHIKFSDLLVATKLFCYQCKKIEEVKDE